MAGETENAADEPRADDAQLTDRIADRIDEFVHVVELSAAAIFALLFAIGVVDLGLQIVQRIESGAIASPTVVIAIIDTGLLLLIIVEVYQTVIAYTRRSETRRIVRLILYTGIIAMVRKMIIFRTGDYATPQKALLAAVAYTVILLGIGALLVVERDRD